jgi:hypothetical protein
VRAMTAKHAATLSERSRAHMTPGELAQTLASSLDTCFVKASLFGPHSKYYTKERAQAAPTQTRPLQQW